jgi:hypothetical protein
MITLDELAALLFYLIPPLLLTLAFLWLCSSV